MATKKPPPLNRRAALNAAMENAQAQLAKLQKARFDALEQLLDDPSSEPAARKADEQLTKIKELESRIATFEQALEAEAEQERQRAAAARIETSRQDRLAVIDLVNARISDLAPAIDAKFNELNQLIGQYKEAGSAADSFARRALTQMYAGDFQRLQDVGSLTLPRASGTSSDNAVALVHQVSRVLEAFGSPYQTNYVQVSEWLPPVNTLTHAARLDARVLRDWFETRFEIKPADGVKI